MLILQHNNLSANALFVTEQKMIKVADPKTPNEISLEFTVLDKSIPEIYGLILGFFERLGLCSAIGITPSEFLDFMIDVDRHYHTNPYHSFYHAVDVTLVIFHMICNYGVSAYLSQVDLAGLIIAALCHDVGHPGLNNNYQVNQKTELAIRFGNKSVLESLSCSITMDLLSKHKLLRNIEKASALTGHPTTERRMKADIIRMILATDMVFHYELQENLAGLLEVVNDKETNRLIVKGDDRVRDIFSCRGEKSPLKNFDESYFGTQANQIGSPHILCLNHEERQCLCQIVLHAADISNAIRPWSICLKWSDLVCEEFFRQGEAEKEHNLPISPNMDRESASQTSISLQFGDFVVSPYFEIFAALFPEADAMLQSLTENRKHWLEQEELDRSHSPLQIPVPPPDYVDVNYKDRGRLPTDMLPDRHIINPSGRRVSVAAGMIVIPDALEERTIGSGKLKRKYLGLRSVSDTGIRDESDSDMFANISGCNDRRKSEEPNTYLQRHLIRLDGRRSSRGDLVERCLERQHSSLTTWNT